MLLFFRVKFGADSEKSETFIAFSSLFDLSFKLFISHTNSHITLGPPVVDSVCLRCAVARAEFKVDVLALAEFCL